MNTLHFIRGEGYSNSFDIKVSYFLAKILGNIKIGILQKIVKKDRGQDNESKV